MKSLITTRIIEQLAEFHGKKTLIYGAGELGMQLVEELLPMIEFIGFVDKSAPPERTRLEGFTVYPPVDITSLVPELIIIASQRYRTEISRDIYRLFEDANKAAPHILPRDPRQVMQQKLQQVTGDGNIHAVALYELLFEYPEMPEVWEAVANLEPENEGLYRQCRQELLF